VTRVVGRRTDHSRRHQGQGAQGKEAGPLNVGADLLGLPQQ
jgi:hypothetical protein